MPFRSNLALALLLVAAAGAPVYAADPLDAKARVAPLAHQSVFSSYRAHDDVKPVPWREANDTVGRIGGWRAYAREAAASVPSAAPALRTIPPATARPTAPRASAPAHRHH